jgi:hypothetical protein
MATPLDPLTPKRDSLRRKIRADARAAGVVLDDRRWTRAVNGEVAERSICGAGHAQHSRCPTTDEPPLPGRCRLQPRDLDLLADNLVKGWR